MSMRGSGYGSWRPGPLGDRGRGPDASTAALFRFLRLVFTALLVMGGFVLPLLERTRGPQDVIQVPTPPATFAPQPDLDPAEPGTPMAVLQANPLYGAGGLPPTECPAPPLTDESTRAQRSYHQILFGCLTQAWREPLNRAGIRDGEPDLFVFSEPGTSPCGSFRPVTGQILAFYCPINQTTYVDTEQLAGAFPADHHIAYGLVVAHEYGHHTQNVAGILFASSQIAYESEEQALEFSRRSETQASCFAGMFFSAVEASYPVRGEQRELFDLYARTTFGDSPEDPDDERTHGTPHSQGNWIVRGFVLNDAGACNTFTAPAAEVD